MTRRIVLALTALLACDPGPPNPLEKRAAGREGERRAALLAVRPVEARGGPPRFTDAKLRDPMAATVFAERLADETVEPDERLALAEALPRCGGAWTEISLARLAIEKDAAVRAALVAGLQRADDAAVTLGVKAGLADAEAKVRKAAAELAGWKPAVSKELAAQLQAALADPAAEVRAMAVRAIGLTRDGAAFDAVARGLADVDADVRRESIRAVRRIDEARAAALPAMTALQTDPDARVQRAAKGE